MKDNNIFSLNKSNVLMTIFLLLAYFLFVFTCSTFRGSTGIGSEKIYTCGQSLYNLFGNTSLFKNPIILSIEVIGIYLVSCLLISIYKKAKYKKD